MKAAAHFCDIDCQRLCLDPRDVRQGPRRLPRAERINEICFSVAWFKHDRPKITGECASACREVAEHVGEPLELEQQATSS